MPLKLFQRELARLGHRVNRADDLAVGMFFLPGQDAKSREQSIRIVNGAVTQQGLAHFGWRLVPVDRTALGAISAATNSILLSNAASLWAGTNPFSRSVAAQMQLPTGFSNGVATIILRRGQVGAPYLSRQISYLPAALSEDII